LGIGDWGLGPIPNPQSPIPNPQSPIPNKILINNNERFYKFMKYNTQNLYINNIINI
jgi:hypothetical protein